MQLEHIINLRLIDSHAYVNEARSFLKERDIVEPIKKKSGKWGIPGSSEFDYDSEVLCMQKWISHLLDKGALVLDVPVHY